MIVVGKALLSYSVRATRFYPSSAVRGRNNGRPSRGTSFSCGVIRSHRLPVSALRCRHTAAASGKLTAHPWAPQLLRSGQPHHGQFARIASCNWSPGSAIRVRAGRSMFVLSANAPLVGRSFTCSVAHQLSSQVLPAWLMPSQPLAPSVVFTRHLQPWGARCSARTWHQRSFRRRAMALPGFLSAEPMSSPTHCGITRQLLTAFDYRALLGIAANVLAWGLTRSTGRSTCPACISPNCPYFYCNLLPLEFAVFEPPSCCYCYRCPSTHPSDVLLTVGCWQTGSASGRPENFLSFSCVRTDKIHYHTPLSLPL